jgi:hypothetical protein
MSGSRREMRMSVVWWEKVRTLSSVRIICHVSQSDILLIPSSYT